MVKQKSLHVGVRAWLKDMGLKWAYTDSDGAAYRFREYLRTLFTRRRMATTAPNRYEKCSALLNKLHMANEDDDAIEDDGESDVEELPSAPPSGSACVTVSSSDEEPKHKPIGDLALALCHDDEFCALTEMLWPTTPQKFEKPSEESSVITPPKVAQPPWRSHCPRLQNHPWRSHRPRLHNPPSRSHHRRLQRLLRSRSLPPQNRLHRARRLW